MFKRDAIISDPSGSAKWQHGLPVATLLFAATLWGISWYPIRFLEDSGIDGLWVSLLVYSGTLLVALPFIFKYRYDFINNKWSLFVIAVLVGWLNIAFILAVLEGQIVRVLLLFYLSPVWAALLGWLILKEQMHVYAWFMIVVAMVGAVIMLWSPELGMPLPKDRADWLALSSGFCFAFANMMIRRTEQVPIVVKTITGWLGVVLVSGLLIIITQTPAGLLTLSNVSWSLLYGIFGMTLMTLSVVYGVSHMPIHRSSVILLFEIVVGAVSAVWLANESIHLQEWWGGSLVIFAAYLSARLEIKEEA